MKNLLTLIIILIAVQLHGQDAPAYAMYRNIYVTPDKGAIMKLEENMAAHNKAYHNAGPYHVNIWRVTSGKNFGKLVWSMGPHTWADIDNRQPSAEHGQDWVGNVVALTDEIEDGGIWRLSPTHSYLPDGVQFTKLRIRVIDVERGENYRFNKLMKNLAEVYKEKKSDQGHALFTRQGATNDGEERVVVFGYNNWQEMEDGIADEYEAVHGEGSWDIFQEEVEEVVTSSRDEMWALAPALSGNPQ